LITLLFACEKQITIPLAYIVSGFISYGEENSILYIPQKITERFFRAFRKSKAFSKSL
jgi:hypothetical protein